MYYLAAFALVFGVNLLPAFGPPTAFLLVLIKLHWGLELVPLVLLAAVAASGGRYCLAVATGRIRHRLSPARQESLAVAKEYLTEHRSRSLLGLSLFVFSPLPSAQLFEAAGLLGVRLVPAALAFFAARLVSYSFYLGAATAAEATFGEALTSSLTSPWGVAAQIVLLVGVVLLARIDWTRLLGRRPSEKPED
ncbi:hypothetical protein ABGB12_01655 [Actinocorallia sp. B10E7]|uniref:hypothetical protein n=1 Tax=Actinocorallia sp. B10E7 TaxID=3153558 RepID=UPI00325D86F4